MVVTLTESSSTGLILARVIGDYATVFKSFKSWSAVLTWAEVKVKTKEEWDYAIKD